MGIGYILEISQVESVKFLLFINDLEHVLSSTVFYFGYIWYIGYFFKVQYIGIPLTPLPTP